MPLLNIDNGNLHGTGKKIFLVAIQEKPERTDWIRAQLWRAKNNIHLKQQLQEAGLEYTEDVCVGSIENESVTSY